MKFWKMNGAGNDFLVLNNLEEHLPVERLPEIARTLCERRLSIGADGLMVVDAPRSGGDYRMLFYNSDGSVGEMCGNGARCICRYGYENGLAGETQTVETTAGIVTGQRIDRRLYRIRLNDPTTIQLDAAVEVDGVRYACSYVELGDPGLPHAVVPYHNLKNADEHELRNWAGPSDITAPFPREPMSISTRSPARTTSLSGLLNGVWRILPTPAAPAPALVTVLTLQGKVSGHGVRVDMTGGQLIIDAQRDHSRIASLYLTGPTNIVCKGEVTDEDLPGM